MFHFQEIKMTEAIQIDLSKVVYMFHWRVVVMVLHKKKNRIWHDHSVNVYAQTADEAFTMAKVELPRHFELRKIKKAIPGKLAFAYLDSKPYKSLSKEESDQIPIPDEWIAED